MYTVCYVLIDNNTLRYYKELIISLSSLRYRGFPGAVRILTDEITANILRSEKCNEFKELSAELIVIDIPDEFSQKERSRFIKTSIRNHIEGDFLFLDTDTIIADSLPDTISKHDIAMVKDGHMLLNERTDSGAIEFEQDNCKKCRYFFDASAIRFNSGVIWCRDTTLSHIFFQSWHDEWIYTNSCGVVRDQTSLCKVSSQSGNAIAELDGRFNVQVSLPIPMDFLVNAIIIHYYNDFNRTESTYSLLQPEIQAMNVDSEIIQQIIESPKTSFVPFRLVKQNGPEDQLTKTEAYRVLKSIYIYRKRLFHILELFLKTRRRLKKK